MDDDRMDEPIKKATRAIRGAVGELVGLATGSNVKPTGGVFMHNAPPVGNSSPEDQEVHCDYLPSDYVDGGDCPPFMILSLSSDGCEVLVRFPSFCSN
jgi:hypothetical protein